MKYSLLRPTTSPVIVIDGGTVQERSGTGADESLVSGQIPPPPAFAEGLISKPKPKRLGAKQAMYEAIAKSLGNSDSDGKLKAKELELKAKELSLKNEEIELKRMEFVQNKSMEDINTLKEKYSLFSSGLTKFRTAEKHDSDDSNSESNLEE